MGKYAREQAHGSPIVAVQQCGQPVTDIEQRLREPVPIGVPIKVCRLMDEAADTIASLRSKLEEAEGARGWQPIETAPKDGTRVWLKNGQMQQPVIGQMDDYRSQFSGTVSRQWIVTHDPYDRFMPLQYGSLCVPSHWMLLASLREADHA